nr:ParB N-terminal domain-containing protein [Ruegeria pomeroyi]
MDVVDLPLEQIIPYARNPRRNEQAIATVAASIQEFGWRQPIVVDEAMVVLAGHTRLEAARKLGFNHFNSERSLTSRTIFKLNRATALFEWRGLCAG